jgi:hypothetical protein
LALRNAALGGLNVERVAAARFSAPMENGRRNARRPVFVFFLLFFFFPSTFR